MKSRKNLHIWAVAIFILGILIGFFAAYMIGKGSGKVQSSSVQVRADLSQYKFINPALYSDGPGDTSPAFQNFRSSLSSYITAAESANKASGISVYFRDLNPGRWIGVNENDLYRPSSMLKVLNMMSVLVVAQNNPGFLDTRLQYQATNHDDQYYKPAHTLTTGGHTVQELTNATIIDSDNDALESLNTNSQVSSTFDFLYSLFKLPAVAATTTNFMSPKSYSAVFRVLYNSSLFPWGLSEQALELLSHTSFNKGLVAGVPNDIVVAHKFGENTALTANGDVIERELHDCGIIYYPNHPYLLCVMTKGQDFPTLESVISDISKMAYNFDKNLPTGN